MIANAIDKVLELAKVETFQIGGRDYTSRDVTRINKPQVDPVKVHTLEALVDYFDGELKVNADVEEKDVVIHVVDPCRVEILSGCADPAYRSRECFMVAELLHTEFQFGRWFKQDEMVINLMTLFEQTSTLKEVIRVASGLVSQAEVRVDDDGVSQEVSVRKGVQRVENVTIENPIMLSPVRTFNEVEQVEAPYVLRVRCTNDTPEVAIFEAGGGQWKNEAVSRIKMWLCERLPHAKVLG